MGGREREGKGKGGSGCTGAVARCTWPVHASRQSSLGEKDADEGMQEKDRSYVRRKVKQRRGVKEGGRRKDKRCRAFG